MHHLPFTIYDIVGTRTLRLSFNDVSVAGILFSLASGDRHDGGQQSQPHSDSEASQPAEQRGASWE